MTRAFTTTIANAVPGVNVTRWTSDLNAQAGSNVLSQAESAAKTAGAFYAKLNSLTS